MTYRKIATLLIFLASLVGFGFAQQGQITLLQTTLAGAVTGPALYSGTSPTIQQTVCLASTTGISTPVLPGTPVSVIYVDREAMGVFNVNTTTGCMIVNRGYLGTQASPHVNGQMVLVGNLYQATLAFGGNPVPSGLFQQDPPQGGTCSSGAPTIPWVNVLTGAQWLCSTISNTWVPGWNNPLAASDPGTTTAVASAAALLPSGPFFHVTGATGITSFTIPVGFDATAAGHGSFCYTTDSTATTSVGNNIGTAITGAAGSKVCWTWDAATSKFYATQ